MQASQKRVLSLLLSIVIFILAIFMFSKMVRPSYQEINELRAEKIVKQDILDEQRNIVAKVNQLLTKYESIPQLVELMSLAVPEGEGVADAFTQVNNLASRNQLALASFDANADSALAPSSPNASAVLEELGVLKVDTTLVGNYSNLKRFLAAVSANIRITNIESLRAQPVAPNSSVYNFSLVLNYYYQ